MKKRIVSLFPGTGHGAEPDPPTTVWAEAAAAAKTAARSTSSWRTRCIKSPRTPTWNGTLVDTDVTLNAEVNTMMDCIVSAFGHEGYTAVGAESNYISKITHGGKGWVSLTAAAAAAGWAR